ncbi:MAG: MFS transporter [Legionellales bacterium]|nr:MFS transporter [Legionellales bacterium]
MNILPFLLIFALINSCIELEISVPSFPSIMSYFGVAENIVGLTITMNLVGFCVSALLYGPLSDIFGRRRIMLIGNGILFIGSLGCVIAQSIESLLFSRFIQGLGAATSAVVISVIISDRYKINEASKLYGIMNAIFTTLMAISPMIGGFINNIIGWRGNYGIVSFICLVSWLLLAVFLPETIRKKRSINLSKILIEYYTLLTHKKFLCAAIIPSFLYSSYIVFVTISPFIYMHIFELNIFDYILNITIVVFSFVIVSINANKIRCFIGSKNTLLSALILQFIGPLAMCFATNSTQLSLSISIFCVGFALIYPIIFAYSMDIFPEIKGTVSSIIMWLRYLICAVITAISSYAYDGSIFNLSSILLLVSLIIFVLSTQVLDCELNSKLD